MFAAIVVALAVSGPVPPDVSLSGKGLVEAAADALRDAIVSGDVEAVTRLISPEGVVCGDDLDDRATVQRDLRARTGTLHAQLFDTAQYRKLLEEWGEDAAGALSFRDFFTRARQVVVDVSWAASTAGRRGWVTWGSPAAGDPNGWPAVQFVMDASGTVTFRAFGACALREQQRLRSPERRPTAPQAR